VLIIATEALSRLVEAGTRMARAASEPEPKPGTTWPAWAGIAAAAAVLLWWVLRS
jgi:hypothetical protein